MTYKRTSISSKNAASITETIQKYDSNILNESMSYPALFHDSFAVLFVGIGKT